jgi:hypothetical protein
MQQPGIDNKLRQVLAESLGASTIPTLTKDKSERGSASIRHGLIMTHSSSSGGGSNANIQGDDALISSPISSAKSIENSKDVTPAITDQKSLELNLKNGKVRPIGFD